MSGDGRFVPRPALITILGNLIENAFDAMIHTPASSTTEVTVSVRDGEHGLLISVDDTGPGMIPEVREHIFERGYSTKGTGHGVGLALVYEIVEAYHGTMRVESEPGIGTSFIITFVEEVNVEPLTEDVADDDSKDSKDNPSVSVSSKDMTDNVMP